MARWGHDHLSDINLSCDRGVKPSVLRAWMCPPLPLWRDGETGANSVGNPGRGVLNMWDTYFGFCDKGVKPSVVFCEPGCAHLSYHGGTGRQVQTVWETQEGVC